MREGHAPRLLVELEHGEVHDPAEPVDILRDQVEVAPQLGAEFPANLVHMVDLVADEEHHIALAHPPAGRQRLDLVFREELLDRALDHAAFPDQIGQSLGSKRLGKFDQFVEETARPAGNALDRDRPHHPALLHHGAEGVEFGVAEHVRHILHLDRDAEVGLVGAVFHHGRRIRDAHKRGGINFPFRELREHPVDHVFHHFEHVVLGGKRHLHIELVELAGGAVGTGVLVAEAGGDLEIAVEPGHHEELFELLGRLGQGIELARMHTAGHEIIPRPFRRTARQDGRLELGKAMPDHAAAQAGDDLGAEQDVLVEMLAAQVQEPVFQPGLLGTVVLHVHLEGQRVGEAFHDQGLGNDLDFSGGDRFVDRLRAPGDDLAGDDDDAFGADALALLEEIPVGRDHHLGLAVVVSQVNEQQLAMVPFPEDPARNPDGFINMASAKFAAIMGSIRMHCVKNG